MADEYIPDDEDNPELTPYEINMADMTGRHYAKRKALEAAAEALKTLEAEGLTMADDECTPNTDEPDEEEGITVLRGTGFAAPYVAGEVALILAENPELKGNFEAVREILQERYNTSDEEGMLLKGTGYTRTDVIGELGLILAANPKLLDDREALREILREQGAISPNVDKCIDAYKVGINIAKEALTKVGINYEETLKLAMEYELGTHIAGTVSAETLNAIGYILPDGEIFAIATAKMTGLVALLLVENKELMARPEALRDIIYAASEPPQEPDAPIDVTRLNYTKALELAKQYEPPE